MVPKCIEKVMMSLVVVLEHTQKGSSALRAMTRERGDTRRQWDGVECFEQI